MDVSVHLAFQTIFAYGSKNRFLPYFLNYQPLVATKVLAELSFGYSDKTNRHCSTTWELLTEYLEIEGSLKYCKACAAKDK